MTHDDGSEHTHGSQEETARRLEGEGGKMLGDKAETDSEIREREQREQAGTQTGETSEPRQPIDESQGRGRE